MSDDFTWLKHRETGGHFRCPNGAVDDMAELGWEPSDAPVEINPAVAEQLAFRQELARQQAEQTPGADASEPKSSETATSGKPKEMSDG
jgi:hypothetical protein